MKKRIIGILIIIIVIMIGAFFGMKMQGEKGDKRVFVLGMDDSFPPLGFRNENNELEGFDIDVAKAVCDKLGWELKVQPISWAAKEQELDSGNIDCIWNGFGYTKDREEQLTLTTTYLKGGMIFIVNPDSPYTTQQDLEGKKIAVQTSSTGQQDLEKSEFGKKVEEIVPYSDYLTAFMDLETGRIDGVYVSRITGNYLIKSKGKNYKTIESEGINNSRGMVVAFKKGNTELRDIVQNTLYELKAEGTLKQISEKWFGEDLILLEE